MTRWIERTPTVRRFRAASASNSAAGMNSLIYSSLLFLLSFSLIACGEAIKRNNTIFATKFSVEAFEEIRVGSSKLEVEQAIGSGFSNHSKVRYPNGSENIIHGDTPPGSKLINRSVIYSRPKKAKLDFIVYEIVYDIDGNVSARNVHSTD